VFSRTPPVKYVKTAKTPAGEGARGGFDHFDSFDRGVSRPCGGGDPLCGLEAPECIEALERAAAELLMGTNLEPREIVRGLLANEGDRQALERGFALIQHDVEAGISTLKVHFTGPRNTADARLVARALQRLSKAALVFNEDPSDQSRFADRRQSQPGRAEFGRERRSLPHRPDRRGR
jgi:hypothetical protein